MLGLIAIIRTSASAGHWLVTMLALALAMFHPAPRHASQHHHQPVRLPELASAGTVARMR